MNKRRNSSLKAASLLERRSFKSMRNRQINGTVILDMSVEIFCEAEFPDTVEILIHNMKIYNGS